MGQFLNPQTENRALIVCALKAEADPFIERLSLTRYRSNDITFYSNGIIDLAVTGVGSEKTKGSLPLFLDHLAPSFVLNAGSCGALRDSAEKGTIYRITRVTGIEKSGRMTGELTLSVSDNDSFPHAMLVSAPKPVLKDRTRAILGSIGECVDMEGFTVASICAERRIQCALYKIVTDITGDKDEKEIRRVIEASGAHLAEAVIPTL